jgi:hypothetical protein
MLEIKFRLLNSKEGVDLVPSTESKWWDSLLKEAEAISSVLSYKVAVPNKTLGHKLHLDIERKANSSYGSNNLPKFLQTQSHYNEFQG